MYAQQCCPDLFSRLITNSIHVYFCELRVGPILHETCTTHPNLKGLRLVPQKGVEYSPKFATYPLRWQFNPSVEQRVSVSFAGSA